MQKYVLKAKSIIGDADAYGIHIQAMDEKTKSELEAMLQKLKSKNRFPFEREYDIGIMKVRYSDFEFMPATEEVYKFVKQHLEMRKHSPVYATENILECLEDEEENLEDEEECLEDEE